MKNSIIIVLSELAQLDIDAVTAYEDALKHVDDTEIFNDLKSFHADHLHHVDKLNEVISKLGGTPVKKSLDLKGLLIEGFTKLRSLTGTEGALAAMEENEMITNKNYRNAIDENGDFPKEILELLLKNYEDEKRHLNYIHITLQKLKLKHENEI